MMVSSPSENGHSAALPLTSDFGCCGRNLRWRRRFPRICMAAVSNCFGLQSSAICKPKVSVPKCLGLATSLGGDPDDVKRISVRPRTGGNVMPGISGYLGSRSGEVGRKGTKAHGRSPSKRSAAITAATWRARNPCFHDLVRARRIGIPGDRSTRARLPRRPHVANFLRAANHPRRV